MLQFIALVGILYIVTNPEKVVSLLPSKVTDAEKKEIANNLSSIGEGLYGTSKTILEIALRLWMGDGSGSGGGGGGDIIGDNDGGSGPFGNQRE